MIWFYCDHFKFQECDWSEQAGRTQKLPKFAMHGSGHILTQPNAERAIFGPPAISK